MQIYEPMKVILIQTITLSYTGNLRLIGTICLDSVSNSKRKREQDRVSVLPFNLHTQEGKPMNPASMVPFSAS